MSALSVTLCGFVATKPHCWTKRPRKCSILNLEELKYREWSRKQYFTQFLKKLFVNFNFFFWWKSSNFDENNQKKVFWFWLEGDKKLFVRWKDSVPASFRMNQSISDEFHYLKPQTRLPNFLYDRVTWENCSLKVQNVEFEMDVSFLTLMYHTSTIHRNLTFNIHLHNIKRPHWKFDIRFLMYCRPRVH